MNSICRTPRNIVLTPLDCALQKGFRGAAKFLQVHGGLPAGKLRLSARRQTGLNDTDLVKPLKFKEKEQNYESKKSKRYVVYVKRSDSELSEREIYNQNQQTSRSRRVKSRCRHHRKKRTSSCSDSFIFTKDDCCNEMNRSKSNIEIRRRMKSKHKNDSYSTDDSSSDEYCNNRRKYRCNKKCCTSSKCNKSKDKDDSNGPDGQESEDKKHKKKRSRRREKRKGGGSNENSSLPSEKSDNEPEDKNKNSNKDEVNLKETPISNEISSLKLETEKEKKNIKEKSLSSSTSKEDKNIDVKIDRPSSSKKRPQSAKASSAQKRKTQQPINEGEKNITDENNQQPDLSDEVEEPPSKLITKAQVHAINETTLEEATVTIENNLEKKIDTEVTKNEETSKTEEVSKQETTEENKTEDALKKVTFGTVEQKTCQEITTTPILDEVENSKKVTEKEQADKNEQSFAVIPQKELGVSPPSQIAPPSTPTQTLSQPPPKKPPQNPPQLPAPSPVQNVSKSPSSFTVIGADDDNSKSSDELVIDEQPQSFQILEENNKKSAVTRIESEQDDEDDVEEFRPSENKKSESASSGDKHGRRKKLKKRSKNIKNYDEKSDDDKKITQQHSKDQDSGFEPSPRAMRTKIPSPKSAHTAVFPRKPAFTMLDDRLCKIEGRKPGDQNAVNMTTVTQSIQKNIRR